MRNPKYIELPIDETLFPKIGRGVYEGKETRVKGAIAGQTVLAKVKRSREGRAEAELVKVTKPAPYETAPDCREFGVCGGCSFRNMPYGFECGLKEHMVLELFRRAGITPKVYGGFIENDSPDFYRNKMEFAFGDDGVPPDGGAGNLTLGLRKKGSFYEAVNADDCRICHSDFGKIVKAARQYFAAKGATFYHRMRKDGILRHLAVRRASGSGEILLNLVTAPIGGADGERVVGGWAEAMKSLAFDGYVASIWHTESDSVADAIKPGASRLLFGEPYINESILGLKFKIGAFSFFQTNTRGAARLYKEALDLLPDLEGKTVYDLYCGAGTIAQICAGYKNAARVYGVEISEEAVSAARETARANGVDARFVCGDVLNVLDSPDAFEGGLYRPDVIIVDPPRDGVHKKALNKIAAYGAESIVYVSCNPVTLIRDLETLCPFGYEPDNLLIIDMFPRAAHVECVALLKKKNA